MMITVVLCTYNRCQSLAKALESVAGSDIPESVGWEVLVVDNNSKDQTREVVEEFCRRYPGRFRYSFEAKQGKSYALNSAIREARGSILAFIDDDVVVAPTWLRNITAPLDSGEWAGAGGRILAANSFECPSWLPLQGEHNLGGVLALFDLGDCSGTTSEAFFGANVAYRKEMFEKYGFYRTDLGRCGGGLLSNEDTEFSRRIIAGGERLWYEPSAVVYHGVPETRLTKSYFLRFYYDHGRSQIREHANRLDVLGIPRWCFAIPKMVLTILPSRMGGWLFGSNPKRRFFYKCTVWTTFGEIVELPRIWFQRKNHEKNRPKENGEIQRSNVKPG